MFTFLLVAGLVGYGVYKAGKMAAARPDLTAAVVRRLLGK